MAPTPNNTDTSKLPVVVMDIGGYSLKVGLSTDAKPKIVPNCISKSKSERRRPFVGSQIDDCRDTSGLFYMLPFEKGYMTRPDYEKTIWEYTFSRECMDLIPQDYVILVTEPQFNFIALQDAICELLFEEFEFSGVCRTTAAQLIDYKYAMENPKCVSSLIIDSGYSFTHIIPVVNGQIVKNCITRINVGGKALTNHLKELISYRQLHVLDETYLMNQVKEDLCFVSSDFYADMELAKKKFPDNTTARDYVLPDYSNVRRGYVKPISEMGKKAHENEQTLRMNNERFFIPELLFHPQDVGIQQMGISEVIGHVVSSFPSPMQSLFYKNIICVGGNTKFPGYKERLYADVRSSTPTLFQVGVNVPEDPITYTWEGGSRFAQDPDFSKYVVSKKAYHEEGVNAFLKKCDS